MVPHHGIKMKISVCELRLDIDLIKAEKTKDTYPRYVPDQTPGEGSIF